jgi:NCAIR mutase (PurE)-related protein
MMDEHKPPAGPADADTPADAGEDSSLDFAVIDTRRRERTGYGEVVYCAGKTVDQALAIILKMREENLPVLATRVEPALAGAVMKRCPQAKYDELSQLLTIRGEERNAGTGLVAVVAAGTSDLPIAREAALTAEFLGSTVNLIADVGVAGIHRLFNRLEDIRRAKVVVAVAGMEGALPGVIAGLVAVPVIAVPTSVGYGASFGGLAALLGMLNSCSPGISVVNIDNGFGAGYQANLINRLIAGA